MDEMQWKDVAPESGATLLIGSATITCLKDAGISLVSGNIDAFRNMMKYEPSSIGLCERVDAEPYLVRIGRDQALWVTPQPMRAEPGWNDGGFAISPNDDAWVRVSISGEGAEEIVRQAVSSEISTSSPSASVFFAEQKCCLIMYQGDYLVFVPSPLQTYVWSWLQAAL